ncbi:MAG: RNA polymerase sigma factor [Dehalococcoidales bacterium]
MEKWQSGNKQAFEQVYNHYNGMVFKNAYMITGSRDSAEDIVQEVFLSAWKFRSTYDHNKGSLATWLHRITVNECTKRLRAISMCECLEDFDLPDTDNRQPEEITITKQECEDLMKIINTMNEKLRMVLVLRYLNDLSYIEIAEIMDLPLGTVKSRLNTATRLLKEKMDIACRNDNKEEQ